MVCPPSITIKRIPTIDPIVQSFSANWNSVYSNVNDLSAIWNLGGIPVGFVHLSGDTMTGGLSAPSLSTNTLYVGASTIYFIDNSGNILQSLNFSDVINYNSVYSNVYNLSGNWENTSTIVENNSAHWNNSFDAVNPPPIGFESNGTTLGTPNDAAFTHIQITNGDVINSKSSGLATFGYSDTHASGVYGGFDGSTITGAYFQLFGKDSAGTGITPPGGGEFIINSENGDTKFNLGTYNGASFPTLLTVQSDGKVGINTTGPGHDLEVRGEIYGALLLAQAQTLAGNVFEIHDPASWFTINGSIDYQGNTLFQKYNLFNGTSVSEGTYDNSTGGANGISLNCAVGYQLNWQGGHLRNSAIGTDNVSVPIILDSGLRFNNTDIFDVNAVATIQPSNRNLVNSNGDFTLNWDAQSSNVQNAIYWFDSSNDGRLTGDGSGLTGVTGVFPFTTPSDTYTLIKNTDNNEIIGTDSYKNAFIKSATGSIIGFDGVGNFFLQPTTGGVLVTGPSFATIINASGFLSYPDGNTLANNSQLYYDNGDPISDNVGNLYTSTLFLKDGPGQVDSSGTDVIRLFGADYATIQGNNSQGNNTITQFANEFGIGKAFVRQDGSFETQGNVQLNGNLEMGSTGAYIGWGDAQITRAASGVISLPTLQIGSGIISDWPINSTGILHNDGSGNLSWSSSGGTGDVNVNTFIYSNSANIINVDTVVNSNSSNWQSNYSNNNLLSANWNQTFTSFSSQSSNNTSNYNTVKSNSGLWGNGGSVVTNLSSNWNIAYNQSNVYASNSAKYESNYSNVNNLSSSWQSTYTSYNSNSSNYNLTFTTFTTQSAHNLAVYTTVNTNSATWGSGGTITSINGTTNQITVTSTGGIYNVSLPSSIHLAGGVFLGNSSGIQWGDNGIAGSINGFLATVSDGIFRIGDSGGGGSPSLILGSNIAGGVRIKRSGTILQSRLGDDSGDANFSAASGTFTGNISSIGGQFNGTIIPRNSTLITSIDAGYLNSLSNYTSYNSNSANYNFTFTNFSTQSANNLSVYTTVNSNSSIWNNIIGIQSLSSNWQSNYSSFNSLSSNFEIISHKSDDTSLGGGTPSSTLYPTQNAVKTYIDASVQGLSIKNSVVVATNGALPAVVYNNGSSGIGATLTGVSTGTLTIDGYVVQLNDRLLIKDQISGVQNGIYICTTVGAIGVAFILTRTTDTDTSAELIGSFVFIEQGSVNGSAGFVNTNTGTITFNVTNITFTQFSGAGEIVAGTGLSKSGNTLNVNSTQPAITSVNNTPIPSSTILITISDTNYINSQSNYSNNNLLSANWNISYNQSNILAGLSANDKSVYSNINSNSANYQSTYNTVQTNSSVWGAIIGIQTLSGNWNSNYSNNNLLSANWNSVYSNVNTTSANWNSNYSNNNTLSSNWNITFTIFNTQSANNLSVYSNVNTNSGTWGSGGGNTSVNTTVQNTSANWNSNYTTVFSNSGAWGAAGANVVVQSNSANWNSVYTNVNTNSAIWGTGGGGSTVNAPYKNISSLYYAVTGDKILGNTLSGSFSIILPSTSAMGIGGNINFRDPYGTWQTNNLNISANGSLINGTNGNLVANVNYDDFSMTYVGGTIGWRMYTVFVPNITDINTVVQSNSSMWGSVIGISSLSANWQNTYTTVNTYSADWARYRTFDVNAASMIPLVINGAQVNSIAISGISGNSATSFNEFDYDLLDFIPLTSKYAQFLWDSPLEWDTTQNIKCKFNWTCMLSSNGGNAVWGISATALSSSGVLYPGFNTAGSVVTAIFPGISSLGISNATPTINIANNPIAGNPILFQIGRISSDPADKLNVNASLLGIKIQYKESITGAIGW